MVARQIIDEMAGKIAERFHPEKVILFGSYARGEASEDSDIDLLVVLRSPGPRGRRSAPIIKMLAQHYALPVDVVVRTPEGLRRWGQVPGSLARAAITEGVTLYERQER